MTWLDPTRPERITRGIVPTIESKVTTMEVPQLFVEQLIEISKKLGDDPSEYQLMKIAGLLRPILLENWLADASAAASLPVVFKVVEQARPEISPELKKVADEAWARLHATRPEIKRVDIAVSTGGSSLSHEPIFPGDVVVDLTPDEFLNHGVVIYNDESYTVENLLRVAANSLGGTHNDGGPNRHKQSEALRNYMKNDTMCGRSAFGFYIAQIAESTLRACAPLVDELTRLGLYAPHRSEWRWGSRK